VRTTITLEPDIAARLRRLSVERGQSFKTTVNEALRAGLDVGRGQGRRYEEVARDLGVRPGIDLTRASELASDLEDEATIRKLELRK
jgi:hypothetical protein